MMDSLRIIKDTAEVIQKTLKLGVSPDTIFTLVVRFNDTVDKADIKICELIPTLWSFIDEKNQLYKTKFQGLKLTSIAIQDAVGTIIYDSKNYLSASNRKDLKAQNDFRIRGFTQLSQDDKERTVDILAQQIKQDVPADKAKPKSADEGWDDFLNNL